MLEFFSESRTEATSIARFVRSTLSLGATGAFFAMGLSLVFAEPAALVEHNSLPEAQRSRLLMAVLAGVALPVTSALIWGLWKRDAAVDPIGRVAALTRPLLVVGFLPVLLVPSVWFKSPLPFLTALACLGLVFESAIASALKAASGLVSAAANLTNRVPAQLRRWGPFGIVAVAGAGYAAFTFYYSLQQHYRLSTSAYDLGIYDNLMFNAMRGHPFRSPVLLGPSGGSYLQGHAEFAMLLFLPLYALSPGPATLLGLQAFLLGGAAVPLFLFARRQLTQGAAVVLALCYLLFAPLHGASFYDFHWLPLAIFFHFWLYYGISARKNWLILGSWLILVLIREDVSVGLAFLGLFLTVSGIRPKLGLAIAIANTLTFAFIKFVVMHSAGEFVFASLIYGDLVAPGEKGFGSVIKTLLTNPLFIVKTLLVEEKLVLALHLFAPLLFLPLRRVSLALLVAGGVFFTLLTTSYQPTVSIRFQYPTHWIPYLFAASTLMLGLISARRGGALKRQAALGAMLFCVTVHSYCFGALLQHKTFVGGFHPVKYGLSASEREVYKDVRKLVAQIPAEASVAATERALPHVSTREWAYTLRAHFGDADYLFLQTPLSKGEKRTVKRAVDRHLYGLVEQRGKLLLLQRGLESPHTEAALRRVGVTPKVKK